MCTALFLAVSVFTLIKFLFKGMCQDCDPHDTPVSHIVYWQRSSRMKKIKLFLHSRKFLHSWLRWMVPQKHKGPGKGDSDLFLFTVSPECVWWAHPRCVSTETLGLVEGPAVTLPLAVWSEAAKFTWLCQSGELQGCCQDSQAQIWDLLGWHLLTTSSYQKPLTQKSSCLWSEEV